MSANSSQKFIARNRAPRVQIEYDVEVDGSEKKVELPFVMGVLADLWGKPSKPLPEVTERKFPEIDVDNFDERMNAIAPRVAFCYAVHKLCLWLTTASIALAGLVQTASAQVHASYADRQNPRLSKSGPIYMDPNVYVYTAEFAKRFQMPSEWISTDLQGADAAAWRMMPSYQECGWGGDPKACRQAMKCEIDLYFDHQRNPLPWDPTRAERYTTVAGSSLNFLANFPRVEAVNHPNYPVARRKLREPARPGDHFEAEDSPFIDPQTGEGLSIQNLSGYQVFTGYDKEVFPGIALLTLLDIGCRGGPNHGTYVLANDLVRRRLSPEETAAIVHTVALPQTWRDRITQAAKEHQERQDTFFKREGEKAIKALRDQAQR